MFGRRRSKPAALEVIDVHAAAERFAARKVSLVDVREPDEFAAGRPQGAVNVPLSRLPGAIGEVPKGPVAFTCRSGSRSEKATRMALEAGREDVVNVAGGFLAWQDAGLPADPTSTKEHA